MAAAGADSVIGDPEGINRASVEAMGTRVLYEALTVLAHRLDSALKKSAEQALEAAAKT